MYNGTRYEKHITLHHEVEKHGSHNNISAFWRVEYT
jgi:hypothetical protein